MSATATIRVGSATEIEQGCGNVFEDLGYPREIAEVMQAKGCMTMAIRDEIDRRGITQARAAELMNLAQSDVSSIVNGYVARFTLDRLFAAMLRFGMSFELTVSPPEAEAGFLIVDIPWENGERRRTFHVDPK